MQIKTVDMFKVPEGVRVPVLSGLLYEWTSSIERKIITQCITDFQLNNKERKEKIIVSLTTFPARIDVVEYAIKSIFCQTVKPDRIILWLADSQFPEFCPTKTMQQLIDAGLEVRFCDDLKAHKKYHYALKEQTPDELVITYDDDLIYPEDSIERLYRTHLRYPNCIACNRAGCCSGDKGRIHPYNTWKIHSSIGVKKPSSRLFPSTGGGTLYPYKSVNEEAFNIKKMKELAFSADDLWMRFMSALNGTKIIKTRMNHKTFSTLEGSQKESLQVLNCIGGENDRVIERLSQEYPNAVKNIFGEDE